MVEVNGNLRKAEDVAVCVGCILETPYGTMPYMRDMGITAGVPGRNTPDAEGNYVNEVMEQVELWEERAVVQEVSFVEKNEKIIPKVVIGRGEQY